MNQMIIGMFYVRVCRCGAVLQQIEVTPFNAKQVAKFNESANRCGYDTEHVTADYINLHAGCICDMIFESEADDDQDT